MILLFVLEIKKNVFKAIHTFKSKNHSLIQNRKFMASLDGCELGRRKLD